jgi:hypothetical protein
MSGKEEIAVGHISGEMISVERLVKSMGIKEGEELDYKTPMGLQIKAKIEKGAPVKLEFFHDGEKVIPEPLSMSSQTPFIHCYWIWEPTGIMKDGIMMYMRRLVCSRVKR